MQHSEIEYGGFWRRLTAFLIDYTLIMTLMMILVMGLVAFLRMPNQVNEQLIQLSGWINLTTVVLFWLYFALWESSPKQATIGKMLMGLKVYGNEGDRISFARATGRHFAKILAILPVFLGLLMIAWMPRKQGLHDLLAKTYVVHLDGQMGEVS